MTVGKPYFSPISRITDHNKKIVLYRFSIKWSTLKRLRKTSPQQVLFNIGEKPDVIALLALIDLFFPLNCLG